VVKARPPLTHKRVSSCWKMIGLACKRHWLILNRLFSSCVVGVPQSASMRSRRPPSTRVLLKKKFHRI
jgi:hypothetical protein